MERVTVIFRKNKSKASKLIRFFTMGEWSHCGILFDQHVYEATFEGIMKTSVIDFSKDADIETKKFPVVDSTKVYSFLNSQLGKEYDFSGAYGLLLTNTVIQDNDKWFCSELVYKALEVGGLKLFANGGYRVTPRDLYNINTEFVSDILSHYEKAKNVARVEITPRLQRIIKRKKLYEGEVKRAGRHIVYRDTKDKATIGWGRNIDDKGITDEEAMNLLLNDIQDAKEDCLKLFKNYNELDEIRQEVLLDMAFNLGYTRLSKFEQTIKAVEAFDFNKASEEMLDSLWAKQVKGRALELSKVMRTGESDVGPK